MVFFVGGRPTTLNPSSFSFFRSRRSFGRDDPRPPAHFGSATYAGRPPRANFAAPFFFPLWIFPPLEIRKTYDGPPTGVMAAAIKKKSKKATGPGKNKLAAVVLATGPETNLLKFLKRPKQFQKQTGLFFCCPSAQWPTSGGGAGFGSFSPVS